MLADREKQLLSHLDKLYTEGSQARSIASTGWNSAIETIQGKTWPKRRPKYKVNAVMNFLNGVIERKAAILTDSRPTISVVSRKKQDDPVAEILQKTIEAILDEHNFEQKLTEFVMLEEYFGFALFNTCWDSNLNYGKGDIDLVVVDPRNFIFDPFVSRSWNLQFGEYCALETTKPTDLLRAQYPDKADDIKADLLAGEVREDSLIHKIRTLFNFNKSGTDRTSVIERSIVRDWWVRDRKNKNSDGSLTYPNWRHIIIAGGCPVVDGANPYIDGNHPFDAMEWGFNVDSAYGINEVDGLESPQVMFNKILASVVENAILMGNNIWIGDQDALSKEDWNKLTNEPGSHVKVRPGKSLRREPSPPLPPYMMATLTMLIQGMEKLSGITEVTEGRKPGQVTSGVAIESLAIMAQTTIRLKARQLESIIQRIGQKLIPRIFAYYTTDRVFNVTGNGKIDTYFFAREKIRDLIQREGMSAFQDYQFKVVPASSLAMTKWQKGLMATQLYQMGLIDEEAALEALEFPHRDEIMQRMAEKQREQQEIMASMARQGGNGKMPSVRGFGSKSKGAKMPASMMRGGHQELGMQEFQMK